jgi:hypothetical protein
MLKSLAVLVLSIAASSCVDLEVRRETLAAHAAASPAPRPDAAPAAPTSATTITVTVDETGGVVELLGGPRLVIPAGSLDGVHEISITQLGDRYPVGGISPAFTFSPHDITFAVPATISFPDAGDHVDIIWRNGTSATRLGAHGAVTHLGTAHLAVRS